MTNNQRGQVPEALRLAEQYDHGDPAAHGNAWKAAVCTELRRQHTRITELESELEAVGAGGVQALSAAPANHNASRALQGLDFIMRVYEPCMGKPAPDEEMATIVEATKRLLLGWWGEHRDTVRAMLTASPTPTPPAEQQAEPGEPAYSDSALLAREMYKSQDDSLSLCASDLQHSAIYDSHVEMQSCMRAVADRITALATNRWQSSVRALTLDI